MRKRCLSSAFAKALTALAVAALVTGAGPILAAEIVVGQVGPMSGPEAGQGRAYAAGMQLHFTALNKAGGINGHKFTLLRKDDGGAPEDTVTLTKQMIAEDNPMVLAGYFGGRNLAGLLSAGILAKEKIALVGYRTSEIQPDVPYLYSVRAGLRDEISKLIEHLATIGIKRLGFFHEAGPGSTSVIAAAEDAARKAGATIEGRGSYVANTVGVTDAVDTFMNMQPQAIIMVSSGAAAAGFIEKYRIAGGAAQLLAHSGADIEQLSKRLSPEQMQGVAIAQVTPSPYKVSNQLVKEFADTAAKVRSLEVPVSYAMMEGYIAARVISEAIRRQGSRPSREGTVLALDGMSNFDLGGYVISFKPGQHSGSSFVELSIVTSAGRIRQ
ncbi:ABC transporter substrate-binding protein [Polaromonas sp. JS666]|uniref:ABC transporter substrate-binding protein n=1 Tax=Polaromonas sp. (strain JS666 / ATCC BAA-500) TaxID=296591 RepID=UPI000881889B|nr:ABC transporter substrate-binding protein [Polaromonas sp. JS666]SDN00456.1 ABC-type branched-chain amino acid transport system, substrate-binding protein [Polaromonas sp. JS666]